MIEKNSTPAADTAQGAMNVSREDLQSLIDFYVNQIADAHSLQTIYSLVYRTFINSEDKAITKTLHTKDSTEQPPMQALFASADSIGSDITEIEQAFDTFQLLSESFDEEFNFKPETAIEEQILKRLGLYSSAFGVFYVAMQDAIAALRKNEDALIENIRATKAGVAHV